MQRRIAAVLVVALGAALIAMTVFANLFTVAPAFEDLSDDFRPVMTQATIDQAREDLAGLEATPGDFAGNALPTFAQALGMTPEQVQAFIGEEFPAVAAGLEAMPSIHAQFEGVIDVLEAELDRFASADAIPASSIPATTMPWSLIGVGFLVVAAGFAIWFSKGRLFPAIAALLGLALIAVPLFLSLPGKAADADLMNENLQPVYTQEMVDGAGGALAVLGAMGTEMTDVMVPALAQQLQATPEEILATMAEQVPALATFPAALGRFDTMTSTFSANLSNYEEIQATAFVPIVWSLVVGGAVLAIAGLLAFARTRTEVAGFEKPQLVSPAKAA